MRLIASFILGVIFTMTALVGFGYFAVETGIVPATADGKPAALESWVANTALHAAIEREVQRLSNPIQPSEENLITGVHLYAENCAICHGASDAKPSRLAQGFYIDPATKSWPCFIACAVGLRCCLPLGGGCRRHWQDDLGGDLLVLPDFYPIYNH